MPFASSTMRDLAEERKHIREQVETLYLDGASGVELASRLTDLTDGLVRQIADGTFPDAGAPAIVATGGYGRRHLAPESDLDILCFVESPPTGETARALAVFERKLWDVGFRPSMVCRTPDELFEVFADDLESATALIDSRLIHGPPALFDQYGTITEQGRLRHGRRLAARLLQGMTLDVLTALRELHTLEPNVKTSPFLLRDLHRLRWVSFLAGRSGPGPGTAPLIPPENEPSCELRDATAFFLRVRFGLHLAAGRADDVLRQPAQMRLAREFGYPGPDDGARVKAFLRDLYRHERNIYLAVAAVEERFQALRTEARPRKRARHPRSRLSPRLVRIGDTVHFTAACAEQWGPFPRIRELLEPFEWAARLSLALPFAVRDTVRKHALAAPAPARDDFREAGAVLRGVLGLHRPVGQVLVYLHFTGLLERLLPEFRALNCLPEFGAYHRYTVDAHSILAAAEFDALTGGNTPRDLERYRLLLSGGRPIEELRFAALMHDTGKALGPNHAENGARLVAEAGARLGFSQEACREMAFLVRHHLLLSHATQFRDIDAPELADGIAETIGGRIRLTGLMLLTFADMRCAGRGAWSGWKEEQLWTLFQRIMERLDPGHGSYRAFPQQLALYRAPVEGGITAAVIEEHVQSVDWLQYRDQTPFSLIREHARLARDHRRGRVEIAVVPERHTARFTVVCDDSPGLFSKLAGGLTSAGLTILAGTCCTRADGIAIDEFTVQDSRSGSPPKPGQIARARAAVQAVLRGEQSVEDLLARRRRTFPDAPVHPGAVLKAVAHADASQHCTVIEVRAPDRTGLLFELGRVMEKDGLNIRFVKIATAGGQAMDTFYVVDGQGRKLSPNMQERLIRDIERVARDGAP